MARKQSTITQQEKVQRSLPVKFTRDQIAGFSDELAESVAALMKLEDEKKQVASDYKGRIEGVQAEVKRFARYVSQKQEYQMVDCIVLLDQPEYGSKRVIRTDSNEEVAVETMTPMDRQTVINWDSIPTEGAAN